MNHREVMQQALETLVDLWNGHLDEYDDQTDRAIQALRSELAKPAAVPDGWVMVPKTLTAEMQAVLEEMLTNCHTVQESFDDLITACPQPAAPAVDVEAVREVIASIKDHTEHDGSVERNWAKQLARAIGDDHG